MDRQKLGEDGEKLVEANYRDDTRKPWREIRPDEFAKLEKLYFEQRNEKSSDALLEENADKFKAQVGRSLVVKVHKADSAFVRNLRLQKTADSFADLVESQFGAESRSSGR